MDSNAPYLTLSEFLKAKFAECLGALMVWTKQGKRTKAYAVTELALAAQEIEAAAANADVYIAISTQAEAPAENKRGSEGAVRSLPGLFADIDLADAKGAETGYPKDRDEALAILDAFPIKPTSLIDTGNGLHAHFDFVRPLQLETEQDREDAKTLSAGFQRALVAHFRKHGRKIDSVGDIVRLCRPPGTSNHKSNPPKAVTVLRYEPGNRVTRAEVQALIDASQTKKPKKSKNSSPQADHARIVDGCAWYRGCVVNGAKTCSEPDWFAGASITALCKDGERIFLKYSRHHPDFKEREARAKLKRAVDHDAPRTCESIAEELGHKAICEACPHYGSITTPLQLGRLGYDSGSTGPLPLGFLRDGSFVLRDQERNIIIPYSANQLLASQTLLGLASTSFWRKLFPPAEGSRSAFNATAAGEAIIKACKEKGPFNPAKVRGRGVWLENGKIIINLGDPIPLDARHQYLCFEPLALRKVGDFDVARLKRLLEHFKFANPQDATLLLGWLAVAPICGVLDRRPHCFLYGPPNCGKTTLHALAHRLLTPLVVPADGQSTEAGIRQSMGPDSLPAIIDEFESDQAGGHLKGVMRLARSSYSAETPVLRGTPEGKAMAFALRSMFLFAAVNPSGMSPADETRIFQIEMKRHDSDREVAERIAFEEAFFSDKGPLWCGYMAGLAHLIPEAIQTFTSALVGLDSRQRQNLATLLAGAHVTLHRALPTAEEAQRTAEEVKPTIEHHKEAFERDDARECLDHLFSHQAGENETLGHWIASELERAKSGRNDNRKRELQNYGIVVKNAEELQGLFIMSGSPAIDEIFKNTRWASRAWKSALRKTEGAFTPDNPIHFGGGYVKQRAIGLPLNVIGEVDHESEAAF